MSMDLDVKITRNIDINTSLQLLSKNMMPQNPLFQPAYNGM